MYCFAHHIVCVSTEVRWTLVSPAPSISNGHLSLLLETFSSSSSSIASYHGVSSFVPHPPEGREREEDARGAQSHHPVSHRSCCYC